MNKMQPLSSILLSLSLLLLPFLADAQAPVSWTSYFDASRPNILGLDHTTGTVSVSYGPTNNDVYSFGHDYYSLPAAPSPYAVGTEMAIERYNHLTGMVVNSIIVNNHLVSDTFPHLDVPGEMVIGGDGSVYITGSIYYDSFYLYDMVIIKYNSSLVEQWRYFIYGQGGSPDAGKAIAVDATGNIYVAGQVGNNGTGTGSDFVVVKMNPAGLLLWSVNYNSNASNNDTPTDITVDNKKNVYVSGYSQSATYGNQYTTLKFNDTGNFIWKKSYNGNTSGSYDDRATSIAVDNASKKVVVTGTATNGTGNTDIATLCYDSSGTLLWTKKINNPGNSADHGFKVLINSAHRVFVGGDVDRDIGSSTTGDLIIRKYDLAGSNLKTIKYNGASYDCDFGDFALSPSGNIYVTGSCFGAVAPPGTGNSLVTLQYNSAGTLQWADILSPPQFKSCGEGYYGWKLALNSATSEAAAGGRHFVDCPGANTEQWLTRRYSPALRTDHTEQQVELYESGLHIYPVPARDVIYFTIQTEEQDVIKITIMNMQGQHVLTTTAHPGENELSIPELPAGIYMMFAETDKTRLMTRFIKQ